MFIAFRISFKGNPVIDNVHLGLISQTGDANAPVFDAFESHGRATSGRHHPAAHQLHERPLVKNISSEAQSAVSMPATGQTWTSYYYAGGST